MRQFLVFRLDGLMGSMGLQAGNERRGTGRWPARSAVRGLIGASLGIDRLDETGQQALQQGYGIAISMPTGAVGPLLIDFHTAQAVATASSRRPASRRAALLAAGPSHNLETILSAREYHEDCIFDVAITSRQGARWSLDEIRAALVEPRYVLFLGRKACPLTAPTYPQKIDADDAGQALQRYAFLDAHQRLHRAFPARSIPVMADPDLVPAEARAVETTATMRRRDVIRHRGAWLFAEEDAVQFEMTGVLQ